TPTAPAFHGECAISNGTDTKIVTYHFTDWAQLSANPSSPPAPAPTDTPPTAPTSGGTNNGGGNAPSGGGGGGGAAPAPKQTEAGDALRALSPDDQFAVVQQLLNPSPAAAGPDSVSPPADSPGAPPAAPNSEFSDSS